MTGADVLIVVKSKTESRFYGTGNLREQYLSTMGKPSDHETKNSELMGTGAGGDSETMVSLVEPLAETPSPSEVTQGRNGLMQVIGVPKSKRSLNLENVDKNVRNVLCTRPAPVLLPNEQSSNSTSVELPLLPHPDDDNSGSFDRPDGFQPTPSPK